jgi:hypothetical protein
LKRLCQKALAYAEDENFEGYSKYDALSSPCLSRLSLGNKYLRLLFTQAVMRAPVNLRLLLRIPKEKNPKGIGLFARCYCNLYDLWGEEADGRRAHQCLNWLMANCSPGEYSGPCWGYNWDWQTPSFFVPRHAPNMVVTTVIGQALVRAFEVFGTQTFLETAREIVEFIRGDLLLLKNRQGIRCYSYTPFDRLRVINISALGAGFMSRLYQHTGEPHLIEEAQQLIRYVIANQTHYGAWYYTDPPHKSHLTHDNYHTGFVLDAILEYVSASGDRQWMPNYEQGIDFYSKKLFLADGTPKFLHDRIYPVDIHGAAQGIITFSRAAKISPAYMGKALEIAEWVKENMLSDDGHFYYQRLRHFTKRFALMRWAQGWMCLALSVLLTVLEDLDEGPDDL